nr:Chain A, THETA DEFENSIN 1 [synthetic construct]2LYF_A Chain A, RTD-1 [synthetic construct]
GFCRCLCRRGVCRCICTR